jgi:acetyl-CoA carboxylase carboxyltransferase component
MKKPVEMRQVIARIADASAFLEFGAAYGPATVCGYAGIAGFKVGIVTNNGPLDPAGSTKVTHFIQSCEQAALPIVWLQNTTGFIVGTEAERAGMIKHGSKQIQALSNATVPQITIQCGVSFGAGNYGMCGPGLPPALRVLLADREDRGDGRRAGGGHDGDRDARWRGEKGRGRSTSPSSPPSRRRSSPPSSARATPSTPPAVSSTTA